MLASLDLNLATAAHAMVSPFLDGLSGALSIAFSGELSLGYGVLLSLVFWRKGLGRWSLAPLAFVLLLPVELTLKTLIHQPLVPTELTRTVYYPLASVQLSGSFPSGHAMRASFLCIFLALLLYHRGGVMGRIGPVGLVLFVGFVGFTRVYLGCHWPSDVVAGLVAGAAVALLTGGQVARWLPLGRMPLQSGASQRDSDC